METIFLNSKNEGYNINSFEQKMIQICESHKEEDRALAFSFIIYDFKNPNLKKVLDDNEYWLALNEISGKFLTVFSLNYKPKKKKKIKKYSKGFKYLTSITTSLNIRTQTDRLAEKYFDGTTIKYPSILFFQVHNKKVTDSLMIELTEETIEESFLEIKEYISSAVDSLKNVSAKNKGNYKEIFNLIASNVNAKKSNRRIKRITKDFGSIVGLISSIKGLF